jgi:hypothetical protein
MQTMGSSGTNGQMKPEKIFNLLLVSLKPLIKGVLNTVTPT